MNANILLSLQAYKIKELANYLGLNYEMLNGNEASSKALALYFYIQSNQLEAKVKDFLNKKTIGISYSSKDIWYVNETYNHLKTSNLTLIIDKENIQDTNRLISSFERKLASQDILLVFISEYYLKSKNCMYELFYCFFIHQNNVDNIIPIWIENTDLSIPAISKISQYWEDKIKELHNIYNTLSLQRKEELGKEIAIYNDIYFHIFDIIMKIKNINMVNLNRENFYENILDLESRIYEKKY